MKAEDKPPSYDDAQRCLKIRRASKSGQYVHPDDIGFCDKMLRKYPEWYKSKNEEIFEATAPFGSVVRKKQ